MRRTALYVLALVVVSLALYGRTVRHPLIWDSKEIIQDDATIRTLASVPSFFASKTNPEIPSEGKLVGRLEYYRPVAKTLLAVEYAMFGTRPAGYHAVSVVLNAVVVVLFFLIVRELMGDEQLAFMASLLYAVNPTRGEAVNWVYSYTSLLLGLFALLSFLLYVRDRRIGSLAAFVGALLSRETAVMVVPILVVYELVLRGSVPWRRRLAAVAPFVGVTAGYLAVRSAVLKAPPPIGVFEIAPVTLFNTIAVIVGRFLKIIVWPDAMVAQYLRHDYSSLSGEVVIGYVLIALVASAFVMLWRRDRRLSFWLAWLAIWPALTFNVGISGLYLMGEKALYLAVGGAAVLAAALLSRVRRGWVVVLVIAALHFSIETIRVGYWSDETEHLRQVLKFAPDHTVARYTLGSNLAIQGHYDEAIAQLSRVVIEMPNHSHALNNLGNCYYALSDLDRAAEYWERAFKADPTNPMVVFNLGLVAERRHEYRKALAYYQRYLALAPNAPPNIVLRIRQLAGRLDSVAGGVGHDASAQP